MRIYAYIPHTHTHIYIYTYISKYRCVCECVCARVCVCVRVCIYMTHESPHAKSYSERTEIPNTTHEHSYGCAPTENQSTIHVTMHSALCAPTENQSTIYVTMHPALYLPRIARAPVKCGPMTVRCSRRVWRACHVPIEVIRSRT